MDLDPTVTAALVAGVVSILVGVISFISNKSTVAAALHETQQAQLKDILARRIEAYPDLWRIHISYETNWVLEDKPKTREWAEQYVSELNAFNEKGGLFFSEDLYRKFHELRSCLYEAIKKTPRGERVDQSLADKIRNSVYGGQGMSGLATHLKDDLGSYRSVTLQRRTNK